MTIPNPFRCWRERRSKWRPFYAFFERTLIDDEKSTGLIMRRFHDGKWQYREMTKAEVEEQRAWQADAP